MVPTSASETQLSPRQNHGPADERAGGWEGGPEGGRGTSPPPVFARRQATPRPCIEHNPTPVARRQRPRVWAHDAALRLRHELAAPPSGASPCRRQVWQAGSASVTRGPHACLPPDDRPAAPPVTSPPRLPPDHGQRLTATQAAPAARRPGTHSAAMLAPRPSPSLHHPHQSATVLTLSKALGHSGVSMQFCCFSHLGREAGSRGRGEQAEG